MPVSRLGQSWNEAAKLRVAAAVRQQKCWWPVELFNVDIDIQNIWRRFLQTSLTKSG